jgi:hypothetical protein
MFRKEIERRMKDIWTLQDETERLICAYELVTGDLETFSELVSEQNRNSAIAILARKSAGKVSE